MKKMLAMAMAGIMAASVLSGCSGGAGKETAAATTAAPAAQTSAEASTEAAQKDEGSKVIGVIPKSTLYDYWKMVRLGCEDAAEKEGYTVRYQGTATNTDIEGQIKIVEDFVTAGVDAIVISPVNPDALAPVLEEVSETIPVIVMDGKLNSECQKTTVSTDNVAAAALGAKAMMEKIGEEGGLVAVVSDTPGSVQAEQRERGFLEEIKKNEKYELLEVFYSMGDRTKAANITQDILTEHSDIKGIFATNEGASAGVARTIRDEQRNDVCVISYDSSIDLIEAIYDGVLVGTVAQDPYNVGWLSVEAALKVLKGEPVEESTAVPAVYVDAENIHDADIIKVLDPLGTLNLK